MTTNYHHTDFQRDCLQAITATKSEAFGLALKTQLNNHYSDLITHPPVYQNLQTVGEKELLRVTDTEHLLDAYANSVDVLITHAISPTESGHCVA